jgi:predicted metalloendopeptidase
VPTKNGRLPINGKLTLGENIADAGGLTAAYQSWKRRDDEKADLMLPGLDHFTKEQIFFLAYGQTWCGKMRYVDPYQINVTIVLTQQQQGRANRAANLHRPSQPGHVQNKGTF